MSNIQYSAFDARVKVLLQPHLSQSEATPKGASSQPLLSVPKTRDGVTEAISLQFKGIWSDGCVINNYAARSGSLGERCVECFAKQISGGRGMVIRLSNRTALDKNK